MLDLHVYVIAMHGVGFVEALFFRTAISRVYSGSSSKPFLVEFHNNLKF